MLSTVGNKGTCSCAQWRHQGGGVEPWEHLPTSRRLCPSPPLSPSQKKKLPKSAIFGKFLDFCPLRIACPKKKVLVPPLVVLSTEDSKMHLQLCYIRITNLRIGQAVALAVEVSTIRHSKGICSCAVRKIAK